jgi:hypothetical protein
LLNLSREQWIAAVPSAPQRLALLKSRCREYCYSTVSPKIALGTKFTIGDGQEPRTKLFLKEFQCLRRSIPVSSVCRRNLENAEIKTWEKKRSFDSSLQEKFWKF